MNNSSNKQEILLRDNRVLRFDRPLVMGVLNVTLDSFSDGGKYFSVDAAADHALRMINEGADIIDIGGESTRPGAAPVSLEEELARVIPVITRIRYETKIPISVDTYKAVVARTAFEVGVDIINDISAVRFDPDMVEVIASKKAPVILMHMLGTPKTMQQNPTYVNCVEEIMEFFTERIAFCVNHGIEREKLIIDPGIGFGKRLEDNLEILAGIKRFKEIGCPVLVGTSRKSFIGLVHRHDQPADSRLGGSVISAMIAVQNGADIVRVHDVAETVEALKVLRAIPG